MARGKCVLNEFCFKILSSGQGESQQSITEQSWSTFPLKKKKIKLPSGVRRFFFPPGERVKRAGSDC